MVLVETSVRVLNQRRFLAQDASGFGVEVSTLPFWVAKLWTLFGDTRQLVEAPQRAALLARVLEEDESALPKTPGMVNFLCTVASNAFCYRTLPANLVGSEQDLVRILNIYAFELEKLELCEYTEALQYLMQVPEVKTFQPIVFDTLPDSFSTAELEFLEALNASFLQAMLQATPDDARAPELARLAGMLFRREKDQAAIEPTGALVPALAAGPTAEHRVVLECIQDALKEDPQACIAVAARDPLAEFEYSAQVLAEGGVQVFLQASKPLVETDAGRAVLNLLHLTQGEDVNKLESTDFSFNPLAGMKYTSAFRLDQSNRANRALDADDILSALAGNMASELQGVVGLFEEQDFECALDQLETFAQKHFAEQPVYLAEQLRALEISRKILIAAKQYGASATMSFESQGTRPISLAYETAAPAAPAPHAQVLFTSLFQVANLGLSGVDYVVIANLDAHNYPIRAEHDSLATLLAKWGKHRDPDPLLRLRQAFYRSILLAHKRVYVQRCLNNEAAEATQPAALFEEVQDCYRVRLDDYTSMDKSLRIATSLRDHALYISETFPSENLEAPAQKEYSSATLPPVGTIDAAAKQLLVLPRDYKGVTYEGVDLSPSQIESYLECPYQWFVKRRLRIETLDEGFGPLERGSFIHRVMQAFYEAFQAEDAAKVTSSNLEEAQYVFDRVFEEQLHRELYEASKGDRYYPVDNHERQLVEDLRQQLRAALALETKFLPHFSPHLLEWEYGMPHPFEYAGCHITGRVDRIDVDESGHAIVVDYKSSVSDEYCLLASAKQESFALPHKVQGLIYAQAVRNELGLDVVGAVYFNVLTGEVYGAFDSRVVGAADFPVAKSVSRSSLPVLGIENFAQLLDETEDLIAQRMEELKAGKIQAQPLSENVCAYCPVGVCEKRATERKA